MGDERAQLAVKENERRGLARLIGQAFQEGERPAYLASEGATIYTFEGQRALAEWLIEHGVGVGSRSAGDPEKWIQELPPDACAAAARAHADAYEWQGGGETTADRLARAAEAFRDALLSLVRGRSPQADTP